MPIGFAMCIYCDLETVRNCMNDICPKGRRIYKGDITFEKVEE